MAEGKATGMPLPVLWVLRVGVFALSVLLLGLWARFPLGEPQNHGVLRLAWRMVGERVRICRDFTQAELEKMVMHMRRKEKCEVRLLRYRVRAALEGETRLDEEVIPAGARGDRPLYVNADIPLAPGEYAVDITFAPLELELQRGGIEEEDASAGEDAVRAALQVALDSSPRYRLLQQLPIRAGEITLVELDEHGGAFVVHSLAENLRNPTNPDDKIQN